MKPGSDMACGCARSVTLAGPSVKRWTTLRRVVSDSAQNTWSSTASSAIAFRGCAASAAAC
jgi:hypothetical protein